MEPGKALTAGAETNPDPKPNPTHRETTVQEIYRRMTMWRLRKEALVP
jgi:hypothetical protein